MDTEAEKLRIQKLQMYLQVASVIISAAFLYVLSKAHQKPDSLMVDDYESEND